MKILTDNGLVLFWQKIKDLYKKTSVSAKQTTTSTADGGTNVMTFTFGDGTSTTLSVKNGSKGSDGARGATGATGAKGEKGDRGPVGETGPQGNSGIVDASSKALINDAVTGGSTSYLSAEVGKLGILTYDCSKGGTINHTSLQDAINAVPSTFRKAGVSIIYKSGDSIYRYALKSSSWSSDSANWFSIEEKVSNLFFSRFANDGEFLDFEEFTKDKLQKIGTVVQGKYINNGIWTDSQDALCVLIPATNIVKAAFYAKSNSCEYAFLQDNTQTPTFCNNTTINSIKARYVVSVEIPNDCAFIYVCAYRGGTSLLSGITLFSNNAILNTKSPILPTGVLDLTKFQNINYGGDAPYLYPDKTRAQIFIPCRNIEYLKITVDNLYRVAILGYEETINNIFSVVPTAVYLTFIDGTNGGVPIQNITKICCIPGNVGTLRLWIRKDDDSDLSLDDVNSHIKVEFISSIENNLDKAKVAVCSALINTVVYVDTKEKKIFFPSTFAIMYGRQQTKSYAFTDVTIVDYNINNIGDFCKIVFNPQNETNKLYVVSRDKPLEAEEYYICGIYKPTGFLTLPAYQYCVDGKQYNLYIRHQSDTIMYYDGDKINLPIKKRNSLALTRIGQSTISNECYYNNELYYAQAMDIFKNYLFRLYYNDSNKSLCKVYDITNILEPTLIDSFPLGYQGNYIHCNACQFGKEIDSETGFPLLYIRNGELGQCTVEKISLHASELLQVININTSNIFTEKSESNIIIGDDGFLWLFGANDSKLFFAKFNVPNKLNSNVSLGKNDVVDSWEFAFQDDFANKTWQGGKIYNGHLYFLFGTNRKFNRLYIFNTSTHELEKLLPLSAIQEECEDIAFLEDSILIGIDDTYNGIYKLNEL